MAEVKWDYRRSMGFFFPLPSGRYGWCVALWCNHPFNEGEDWRDDVLVYVPSSMLSCRVPTTKEETDLKGVGHIEF